MSLWRNIHRLAFAGAAQGVQSPGEPNVQTPIQAVQLTDDARRVAPPPLVPDVVAFVSAGAVVGQHGGFEIRPGGGGMWITMIKAPANGRIWRADVQTVATRAAAQLAIWGPPAGGALEGSVNEVHIATANIPAGAPTWLSLATLPHVLPMDLFLPPGQALYLVHATANSLYEVSMTMREVPTRDRSRS